MRETILITGAAGFIGSNFIHWLIKNTEYRIIAIDNLSGGFIENLPRHPHVIFYEQDILDQETMDHIFDAYRPAYCYHFAAYAAEGRSNYIRRFNHHNNTLGTAVIRESNDVLETRVEINT